MGTRLQGKVAVVLGAGAIGAGWGNGKASAVLYAREGAKVFATDTPHVHAFLRDHVGGDTGSLVETRARQTPMRRMGTAWDVAYAALFLASDEAQYVAGTELVVDGGASATAV